VISRQSFAPRPRSRAKGRQEGEIVATLVTIAYPDPLTAEEARRTVQNLQTDLVIQADQVAAISRDDEG